MLPVTKEQAVQQNMKKYYTGRPCRKGHDSERYTSNGMCVECLHPRRLMAAPPEGSNVLHGIAFPQGTPQDTMVLVMKYIQDNIASFVFAVDSGADQRSKGKAMKMISNGWAHAERLYRCYKAGLVGGADVWMAVYPDELFKDSVLNPACVGGDLGIFMSTVYTKNGDPREVWLGCLFDIQNNVLLGTPVYLWKQDLHAAQSGLIGPKRSHS